MEINDLSKPHDPSTIPIPTHLLDEEEEETVQHVVDSSCNKAVSRKYMFCRFGKFITSMKVAYLNYKHTKCESKDDDIDSMLANFKKSNEIQFTSLSDIPKKEFLDGSNFSGDNNHHTEETVTVLTTKDKSGNFINSPVSKMSLIKGIKPVAKIECKDRGLSCGDIIFMSVAWTILQALCLFMLCPEAIWGDVTSHSNNKGFDFLTFSCQTSIGKQLIFLWIWIPNQKRFSF